MSDLHFSPRPNQAHEIRWRAWSPAAFAEATELNRPVLLSLSAVWCHWCHVMDETTYSDPAVIEKINAAFVPIRVDADRRPDINVRYNAGGWPTTAFLTADGQVLTSRTYIPPQHMTAVLDVVLDAYRNRREEIAQALAEREQLLSETKPDCSGTIDESIIATTLRTIEDAFDEENGGFGDEPKFPHVDALEFLLLEYERTHDPAAERMLTKTLLAMARGGMYDHIEGGFFRYSTTRDWSIPHFEKMTEDHAGLLRVYARAWRRLGISAFRETLVSALSYVRTTLRDRETHLFAGSQDADETYYAASLEERRTMRAPYVDRTSYTNWTAALAGACAVAGAALADDHVVEEAERTLDAIHERLLDGNGLAYHYLAPGEAPRIGGLLVDQAAYLRALIDLHEIGGQTRFLERALTLAERIDIAFSDSERCTLYDLAHDERIGLLSAPATPITENACVADSLLRLAAIVGDEKLRERAQRILRSFSVRYAAFRVFAASYASATARDLHGGSTVTLIGAPDACAPLRDAAHRLPDPLLVTATLPTEGALTLRRGLSALSGQPTAYICHGRLCAAPVTDAAILREAYDTLRSVATGTRNGVGHTGE